MELELRLVRSFLIVAEERHFGRAANRLHIAQPPLSQQMRKLENQLGAELIDRGSRPITLTAAGTAFLEEARLILDQAQRAVERTGRVSRGELGDLSVGAIPWAYNQVVPLVITAFRARVENVSLRLSTGNSADQGDGLRSHRLDVGFGGPQLETKGLELEALVEDPLTAVVPENHPLAREARVSVHDLAKDTFVSIARASATPLVDAERAAFARQGLTRNEVLEAPDVSAQLSLIAAGVGVGLQLASFANLHRRGLTAVPLQGDAASATLMLLWRRDDDRGLIRLFLDTARDAARSLDPTRAAFEGC